MFKKSIKSNSNIKVNISISKDIISSIFNECDKYDYAETGGRLIGFITSKKNEVNLNIFGEIGPGPNSRRTATSFFQDGEFQEEVFREIEIKYPEIEHIGNWHTHHVNGLETLSNGDIKTYNNIVNHQKYNADFFIAFLITSKNVGNSDNTNKYNYKIFLFSKNVHSFVEVKNSKINIIDSPAVWVGERNELQRTDDSIKTREINEKEVYKRTYDKITIENLYSDVTPTYSKAINSLIWKGKINLINKDIIKIIVAESINKDGSLFYTIFLSNDILKKFPAINGMIEKKYSTAIEAIITVEREINILTK